MYGPYLFIDALTILRIGQRIAERPVPVLQRQKTRSRELRRLPFQMVRKRRCWFRSARATFGIDTHRPWSGDWSAYDRQVGSEMHDPNPNSDTPRVDGHRRDPNLYTAAAADVMPLSPMGV